MEYPLLIPSALNSQPVRKKWLAGVGGGTEEAKLKKQEKAETSQFIEDLHLVFNGFFHFISPDFLKLANTLDPGGKHMGKNKTTKTKQCKSL